MSRYRTSRKYVLSTSTVDADPRRILILFADYGFGHRAASLALKAALEQLYDDQVLVEMLNPIDDPAAPGFLRKEQRRYDRRVIETPQLYKLGYEIGDMAVTADLLESSMVVLLYDAVRIALKGFRPHAILCTYPFYLPTLSGIYTLSGEYIPILTVVTDFTDVNKLWFNSVAELTAVPTGIARRHALERGLDPESVLVTGIPVMPAIANEQRSKAEIRRELGWDAETFTLLAVGSKRVRNLPETLHVLNHSGLPLQLALVAGGNDSLFSSFQTTEWHHKAHIYNKVSNIPTMLHAADALLCKAGGLITSEALAAGLPLLYVDVIQGQETGNVEYILEQGAGELAIDPLVALETLFHWLDNDGALLGERAANAKRIAYPQAAFEIAQLAYMAAVRGPRPVGKSLFDRKRLTALLDKFNVSWRGEGIRE
jgi:1,2-diacylglycerol 3-beta-galactosyltransferase